MHRVSDVEVARLTETIRLVRKRDAAKLARRARYQREKLCKQMRDSIALRSVQSGLFNGR